VTLKFPPPQRKNFTSQTKITMNDYVTYNAEYQVLICCQHQYAIPPEWITRHFQNSHQATPLVMRQAIVEYSRRLTLASPEDFVTGYEPVEAIKGLKIVDGFQCRYDECSELRGTEGSIQKHCRESHKWVAAMGVKWRNQHMQTIFDGTRRK